MSSFTFCCPTCRNPLEQPSAGVYHCPTDKESYKLVDGIWRFLPAWRVWNFDRFIKRYEYILEEERWGSIDRRHYLGLPKAHPGHPHAAQWRHKAADYWVLLHKVIQPLHRQLKRPMTILDLGAGNAWLTYRLGQLGHQVAALDISAHCRTGLGAWTHYGAPLTLLHAEFDHIPLTDNSTDLVIFNDSIHYSTDYATTLTEARRVLKPEGKIVIMGSPLFRKDAGGYMMVNVFEDYQMQRFGFMLDSLKHEHFLTRERVKQLQGRTSFHWADQLPTRLIKRAGNLLPAFRLRVHVHPDAYVQQVMRQERNLKRLAQQMFEFERRFRWRRPEQPQFPVLVLSA